MYICKGCTRVYSGLYGRATSLLRLPEYGGCLVLRIRSITRSFLPGENSKRVPCSTRTSGPNTIHRDSMEIWTLWAKGALGPRQEVGLRELWGGRKR